MRPRTRKIFALLTAVILLGGVGVRLLRQQAEPPAPGSAASAEGPSSPATSTPSALPESAPHFPPSSELPAGGGPLLAKKLQELREGLPRITKVREQASDDFHDAPDSVVVAGAAIGEWEEYLTAHPEATTAVNEVYAECATDRGILPAIRALCLYSLKKRPDSWTPEVRGRLSAVDIEVQELEKEL